MAAKVHDTVGKIIAAFESGDIPEAITFSMFPIPDLPMTFWSLLNRSLVFLSGSIDARGYRQWQQANRWVKKGSKAIYILVPCIRKETNEETGENNLYLYGFRCQPVYRVEDTDGEHLEYRQIELPEFTLIEKAKEWGLEVKAIPGNYRYYGYYSSNRKLIAMATPEEKVFFHELSHAAHEKVKGSLKSGQDPFQEIIAELSAAALCRMVGKKISDTLGNSYRYIRRYADKLNLEPHIACLRVMSETEKVLKVILERNETNEKEIDDDQNTVHAQGYDSNFRAHGMVSR